MGLDSGVEGVWSRLSSWDFKFWVLGFEFWVLGSVLSFQFWVLGFGFWALGFGC